MRFLGVGATERGAVPATVESLRAFNGLVMPVHPRQYGLRWLLVVLHMKCQLRLLSILNHNYVQHLIHQYPEKWKEYQSFRSAEEKKQFFQSVAVPFVNKLESHFESEGGIRFLVNKYIVEVIIGDFLFHSDDIDGLPHARSLSLFGPLEVVDDDDDVEHAKDVFTELQGLTTLLSQQRAKMLYRIDTYCRMTQMEEPLAAEQLTTIDRSTSEICGSLSHDHARSCSDGLDLFSIQKMAEMDSTAVHELVVEVPRIFVSVADGIHNIVLERDFLNQAGDAFPPVLPHQLVKIDLRAFNSILSD
ncbi:hypothetical protein PsorP6_002731 [Peronosclerospora sorghi]|uniref:Uncharacterized protein n=1 Tax=Peronosclerospora sorghi TaxID=230839 RepID=A0ACC0WZ61_9STRA|nr:hypothetical protein PsorP6_002731 [Peronosclerospora sorghi]